MMTITLRGTGAEIIPAPGELLIIRLTDCGAVQVLELTNIRVTADPYSDQVRLDADLIGRTTDTQEGGHHHA
jgi:hypothetical protein